MSFLEKNAPQKYSDWFGKGVLYLGIEYMTKDGKNDGFTGMLVFTDEQAAKSAEQAIGELTPEGEKPPVRKVCLITPFLRFTMFSANYPKDSVYYLVWPSDECLVRLIRSSIRRTNITEELYELLKEVPKDPNSVPGPSNGGGHPTPRPSVG